MKYKVAVYLPMSLWLEVDAADKTEALNLAREQAIGIPIEQWNDDCSNMSLEIVE